MAFDFKPLLTMLLWLVIFCGMMTIMMVACQETQEIQPPRAKVIPKKDTLFGDVRIDNYYWLRERDNPEVLDYLKAENAYTEAVMEPTKALQEKLFREMKGRIKETDLSVPVKWGGYYYYSRTEAGKQYRIHCRKKGSMKAPEEVLLDENQLAKEHDFLRIGVREVSPDHRLLAYSVDTSGSETYTLYIKNLETGELLSDAIPNTYYSVEWGNDNRTLFYTVLDAAKRPYKLYRHVLGNPPEKDELVYHEPDEKYFVSLYKSKDREYIFLELESQITTEVRFLNANQPQESFRVIHPRQHEMEYSVEHHSGSFYILTNDQAKNFRLMKTPVDHPGKKYWQEVVPHREDVMLEGMEMFKNHLVLFERKSGLRHIHITDFRYNTSHDIDFPEPVYTVWRDQNPEFDSNILRFSYTSLVTPKSIYDYNMDTRKRRLMKQEEVLGGYDPKQYQSERIFAEAPDGTKIPISVVYKKGFRKDGSHPFYLYGYGSYGATIEPYFNSNRLSLLDRGFGYAIAHVRGGGEMGRQWYEDGKLLKKKNTFTDFIACAEHLVGQGYTIPNKLVIAGGSAGGLLMGAVTNMRPDLFNTVIAKVPFVDVLNTMLDPTIPLTVTEYEEWGNPNIKEYYFYIKSYSPYDNVEAKAYPNMFVTAGLNDPRVQYWEPAKWTAKLRAHKTDDHLLLLKINMGAGHGGASGRYDYLKEIALEYSFIFDCLDIQ